MQVNLTAYSGLFLMPQRGSNPSLYSVFGWLLAYDRDVLVVRR